MSDPLRSPTLQGHGRQLASGERPWRIESQFWVAFFGGPLAASAIAFLNCRRLGVAERSRRWVVAVAVAGLGAAVLFAVGLVAADVGSGARLGNQAAGVLAYLPLLRLQKPADRVYRFYSEKSDEEAYSSLWGPGLAAVFALGLPVTLVLAGIAAA